MAQATTLNDAQIKRALRYCQARRHVTRDTTILQFSLYTGLRAKELAALRISDVYDAEGAVRTQFTLSKSQTKGSRARTVFVNKQLAQQLAVYRKWRHCSASNAPLFRSQKGGTLLSQHNVPAVPQHIPRMWTARCKQSQWKTHIHHTLG